MEANQPMSSNSKEEILSRHYKEKYGATIDVSKTYKEILSAMTEYRSIGEREAREQVINELVGWMERKINEGWYSLPAAAATMLCITYAKSLLNQQGEETKKL